MNKMFQRLYWVPFIVTPFSYTLLLRHLSTNEVGSLLYWWLPVICCVLYVFSLHHKSLAAVEAATLLHIIFLLWVGAIYVRAIPYQLHFLEFISKAMSFRIGSLLLIPSSIFMLVLLVRQFIHLTKERNAEASGQE